MRISDWSSDVCSADLDERSVMLGESESSGVRRGVSRPCKSGNCVVYWSQSSKKRPSIDCLPSPISAAHRHTLPFHEVRCTSPQLPTFVSSLATSSPHRDPRRSFRQPLVRQFYSQRRFITPYQPHRLEPLRVGYTCFIKFSSSFIPYHVN